MKLQQYLLENNLSKRQFTKVILVKSGVLIPQGTLSKYVLGSRIPSFENMKAIMESTDGAVEPNDFYL